MSNQVAEIKVSYNNKPKLKDSPRITSSRTIYDLILDNWDKDTLELQEEFKVILINRANRVLGIWQMSKGGMAGTVVDIKLIFAIALKAAAHSIVLVHNHPSGNLTPSLQDIEITKKIVKGGELLDVKVIDHLIITSRGYYSFADERRL